MKTCSKCGFTCKLAEASAWFWKDKLVRDGFKKWCKKCVLANRLKHTAEGNCGRHPSQAIDPRSKNLCIICLETATLQAKRERSTPNVCYYPGCSKRQDEGVTMCKEHRDENRQRAEKGNAKKRGIRYLPQITPTMLSEFQNHKCWLCGMKANGSALHRDHNHVTGWLRGYLCGPDNARLPSKYTDSSLEEAKKYFMDHDMDKDIVERILNYLENPPYFLLLESKGYTRPSGSFDSWVAVPGNLAQSVIS